jgi:hypothetical protein
LIEGPAEVGPSGQEAGIFDQGDAL